MLGVGSLWNGTVFFQCLDPKVTILQEACKMSEASIQAKQVSARVSCEACRRHGITVDFSAARPRVMSRRDRGTAFIHLLLRSKAPEGVRGPSQGEGLIIGLRVLARGALGDITNDRKQRDINRDILDGGSCFVCARSLRTTPGHECGYGTGGIERIDPVLR
jgi:hypothetical protein